MTGMGDIPGQSDRRAVCRENSGKNFLSLERGHMTRRFHSFASGRMVIYILFIHLINIYCTACVLKSQVYLFFSWKEMTLKYRQVSALAGVARLVGAPCHTQKGCRLNSWSGHIPRFWVRSSVGEPTSGNQSMILSHIYASLSFSSPSSLSKSNEKVSLDEDKKYI